MGSDSEWELVDREEEDRPILGFFIPSVGFLPLGKQEDSSDDVISGPGSVVPASFTVLSSSVGLVLSRGPWSAYHVVDTLSGARHHLPRPSRAHRSDTPSVVIRRGADFTVVCAVADPHSADGVYTFDAYSSSSGRWSHAEKEKFAIGAVDPDSGVAAAGSAYWRTTSPTSPMVVGYDPLSGRVRVLTPPAGAWASKERWQLGSARGRLCCVVLTESSDALGYALEGSTDKWRLVGSMGLSWWPSAVPARFESCSGTGIEVVLAAEGNVVVADLERERIVSIAELRRETTAAAKKMVPCVGNPLAEEYVEVLGSAPDSD